MADIINWTRVRAAMWQGEADRKNRKPCVTVFGHEYENRAWAHGWARADAKLAHGTQTTETS